jgi:nitrogen fixation protein FixH
MANAAYPNRSQPLTGGKVLLMLLAFFGVVFAVNGLMTFDALSTFRGEVVAHPYEAGLAYNSDIAAAEAQTGRHWRVDVSFQRDGAERMARAGFLDADGHPLEGLQVSAVYASPADKRRDQSFAMKETIPGTYVGATAVGNGVWDFEVVAKRGAETLFRSKNRVSLD